jgi:CRISPR-associated protein Cas2
MTRRRYLIGYDIADPRRLRKVIKVMESYGQRLQYSVFLCDLSGTELLHWQTKILDIVNLRQDSIVRLDLGAIGSAVHVEVLGKPRNLPSEGTIVI